MSDNNIFTQTRPTVQRKEIDEGLRGHMLGVYNKMTLGVIITAVVAWMVSSSPVLMKLFLGGPQAYLVMFAPLAIIWFGFRPDRMSAKALMAAFIGVSVIYGISFSTIALAVAGESIARAFFIAAAMFAGLSVFGYTTKKDLAPMQSFLVMGIWGLFAASIIGIFFQSSMLQNIIAGAGIVLFSGMTVWQTQAMKEMYSPSYGKEMNERMGWAAALNLYISFIAMFQYILHFLNQR